MSRERSLKLTYRHTCVNHGAPEKQNVGVCWISEDLLHFATYIPSILKQCRVRLLPRWKAHPRKYRWQHEQNAQTDTEGADRKAGPESWKHSMQGLKLKSSVTRCGRFQRSRTQVQLPPAMPWALGFFESNTELLPFMVSPPAVTLKTAVWWGAMEFEPFTVCV